MSAKVSVPADFTPLVQTGFLGHVAGIHTCQRDAGLETCLVVEPYHLNPNGTVHGGVLLTLLDYTLGGTVEQALLASEGAGAADGRHPATISITTQFTAAAGSDAPLLGRAWVQRRTRSITFVAGEIASGDVVVATASAIFKNPPPLQA